MALDDGKLFFFQSAGFVQDSGRDADFSEVVQHRAQGEQLQVAFGIATEHAKHGRKDCHVDTVGKGIGIMQTDVRELYKILFPLEYIHQDLVGDIQHGLRIQTPRFLYAMEGIIDLFDSCDAGLFLHDIFRRLKLEVRIFRGYGDRRDADILQMGDIFGADGLPLYKIARAVLVEYALGDNHALFEFSYRYADQE